MGRVGWFRSQDFLIVLRCAAAAITAVARVAAQCFGNGKKGGEHSKKTPVKRK